MIHERAYHRWNEAWIAEEYCIQMGKGYCFKPLGPMSDIDGYVMKDGVIDHPLELRFRGYSYESASRKGWVPVGAGKLDKLLLNSAYYGNLFSDGLFCIYQYDGHPNGFYMDNRHGRRREKVYKVPIDEFVLLFRMPVEGMISQL